MEKTNKPTSTFCIHLKPREECDNAVCRAKGGLSEQVKHTPGPWHVEPQGNFRWNIVHQYEDANHNLQNAYKTLAEAYSANDARLIAAAPELLEALQAMVEWFTTSDPEAAAIRGQAIAAIAKATRGGQ